MAHDNALQDKVRTGPVAKTKRVLLEMQKHFLSICDWIKKNSERSERNVTLFNLLVASSQYLQITAENVDGHGSVLALATRSLYELNLRVRYILRANENLRLWLAEGVTDKTEMLEGLLTLDTVSDMKQ